jgi:hypothetical protein
MTWLILHLCATPGFLGAVGFVCFELFCFCFFFFCFFFAAAEGSFEGVPSAPLSSESSNSGKGSSNFLLDLDIRLLCLVAVQRNQRTKGCHSPQCTYQSLCVSPWVAPSLVVRFGAGNFSVAWSVDIRLVCKLAKRSENDKPRARFRAFSQKVQGWTNPRIFFQKWYCHQS